MSGSSSSSEDEYGKIKEAVDGTFLTEDLYADDKLKEKCESSSKTTVSLRNQNRQELSTNPFSVKVTPEFQKHVSKHLSRLLDELIDDTDITQNSKKFKANRNVNSGVRLLSTSVDYLTSVSGSSATVIVRKCFRKGDLNEIDYKKRAKEVAVSPEWVLSQEETRFWAPDTRGKLEVIKL